jgi:tRNA threonylcarbamoyladenosine biosynthesis protein TsaE
LIPPHSTALSSNTSWQLADTAATEALGAALADLIVPGSVIHLAGELGTGKTTFARGLLRALGVVGHIKSPTFSLVEPYNGLKFSVYHFDFYRLSDPRQWLDAGFDEYFDEHSVVLVEWPERVAGMLAAPDLRVELDFLEEPEAARSASIHAFTERGAAWLSALETQQLPARRRMR